MGGGQVSGQSAGDDRRAVDNRSKSCHGAAFSFGELSPFSILRRQLLFLSVTFPFPILRG